MVMELVEHFSIAGIADAGAYLRLPPDDAAKAFASLTEKGYLKVGATTEADCLYVFTLEGREAAKKIPDIDEPMCIPITNIQLERGSDNETD